MQSASKNNKLHKRTGHRFFDTHKQALTPQGKWIDHIKEKPVESQGYYWGVGVEEQIFLPQDTQVLLHAPGTQPTTVEAESVEAQQNLASVSVITNSQIAPLQSTSFFQVLPKEALQITVDQFKHPVIPYQGFITQLDEILSSRAFFWEAQKLNLHYSTSITPEMLFNYTILPLHLNNQSPTVVNPRYMGQWLAGSNKVFTKLEIKALTDQGVVSNDRIPQEFLLNSLEVRRNLYEAMMLNREDSFETTNVTLAEDFQFLSRSLGIHTSFHHNNNVHIVTKKSHAPVLSLTPEANTHFFDAPLFSPDSQPYLLSDYGIAVR